MESQDKCESTAGVPRRVDDMYDGTSLDESSLNESNHADPPCYIAVEDEAGAIHEYPIDMNDDAFTVNPKLMLDATGDRRKSIIPFVRRLRKISNGPETSKEESRDNDADSHILSPELIRELTKTARKRLVAKGGHCNVQLKNVPKKNQTFLRDLFTTAIDMPWRYTISFFAMSFFLTWTIFAVIWYIIAYVHGDLEPDNLPDGINQRSGNFTPCVLAIKGFTSCYLFSVETQATIGYGNKAPTEECPVAIIVLSLQSIIGVMFSSCMAGMVFAKLARPKSRTLTVVFSKNAVISMRNGQLYLIFRIGNLRKSHLIHTHVRVHLVHAKKTTAESENDYFCHEELKVSAMEDNCDDRTMMILPCAVYHKIDSRSPFYDKSPKDILDSRFEMVVALEGVAETTGNSLQARTSFLPREILWGYRFENMISYKIKPGTYVADLSYLNAVIQDETPRLSMRQIEERRAYMAEKSPNGSASNRSSSILKQCKSAGRFLVTTEMLGGGRMIKTSPGVSFMMDER